MIKFFNDNEPRSRTINSLCLAHFLKRIDYIRGLPEGLSIDKIINFKDEKVYNWNKYIFEEYLIKEMKENHISQEEYNKYIKLVE